MPFLILPPRHITAGLDIPLPSAAPLLPPGHLGLYFPNRGAYYAWARAVDDEAPGLHTRLLTVDAPDGGRAVFFQPVDRRTLLAADGVEALCDAARRLGNDLGNGPAAPVVVHYDGRRP